MPFIRPGIEGLWLLPVGDVSAQGSEVFTSKPFADLLSAVREDYDYVLIDSEPLLAVSDPCVIASQVDGVLLVLRPTNDSRWRAERAKELLDAIDVRPIGVVVNGLGGPGSRGYSGGMSVYDQAYGAPEQVGTNNAG